jgi:hypothetical protein
VKQFFGGLFARNTSQSLKNGLGRKLTFDSRLFGGYERPVLVRADIRPDRTSAFHPKAAIRLE